MSHPLFQIEAAAGRFENLHDEMEDPAFLQGLALDPKSGSELFWQLCLVPGIEQDEKMRLQFNSRVAFRHPYLARAREFLTGPSGGVLISEVPPGRFFSRIPDTLRDELYLDWMGQALSLLASMHPRGWFHLAQNEFSWWVLPKRAEQEEHLFLLDLGLFPELPLGGRIQPGAIVTVPPELWAGEPVDSRADLYALAALFLRQRSPSAFQKFDTPKKLLDLHRGGRMVDLVPKSASRLNDLLRRMLQANPLDRPASAIDCLREIRQEEIPQPPGEASPWLEARHRRRQVTLILSMIHSLLMEGEWETAGTWLEEIRPRMSGTHGVYLDYLQAYLNRHLNPGEITVRPWENPKPADPRLRVLVRVERADWERRNNQSDFSLAILDDILREAKAHPDPELAARVFLKRARLKRNREDDPAAFEDLFQAWELTREVPGGRLRESICGELAELFLQHGLYQAAWVLLSEALPLAQAQGEEYSRLQVLAGLALMNLERWEESARHFYEGKSGFSARKLLTDLIWASSHELRFFLAQKDFSRVWREFRILLSRAKDPPWHREWLDLLHLLIWMEGGELPTPDTEREARRMLKAPRLADFREAGWSPADSCNLLARVARRLGEEELCQAFTKKAEAFRDALAPSIEKYSRMNWDIPSEKPGNFPETVAELAESAARAAVGGSSETQQLQSELAAARDKLRAMEEEMRRLKDGAPPAPSAPERAPSPKAPRKAPRPRPPDRKPTRSESERQTIEDALRRNLGNREKAAKELGINRRTLFAKLDKYGLKDISFLPSREDVLLVIQECGGKKNDAAGRLGMTRSTFYRYLKDLGIV